MSGKAIRIKAVDGHAFDAWQAAPAGKPRAGLLILQEIFGVNAHIRHVTEAFAGHGYLAVAPALFDRVRPGAELGYSDFTEARSLMQALDLADITKDLEATVRHLREALGPTARVGAVGYCWGGAIADLAACRTDIDAAVAYYGRANVGWLDEKPRCPVLYHFGAKDPLIPPEIVEQIRNGRPGQEVHVYPDAGHGFSCDERPEFHAPSAALAFERTLAFLDRHFA